MFGLGTPEILIIALVILVIFGSAKIPTLARSLGQAKKEFQKGLDDESTEDGANSTADSGK